MNNFLKYVLLAATCLALHGLAADVTEPKLGVGELPEYPEAARIKNLQGTVVVEALVDENGKVFAADVVQAVHRTLDQAAVEAVSNWTFEPAMKDGKAVMKVVQIPVAFNLVDPARESLLKSQDSALAQN